MKALGDKRDAQAIKFADAELKKLSEALESTGTAVVDDDGDDLMVAGVWVACGLFADTWKEDKRFKAFRLRAQHNAGELVPIFADKSLDPARGYAEWGFGFNPETQEFIPFGKVKKHLLTLLNAWKEDEEFKAMVLTEVETALAEME